MRPDGRSHAGHEDLLWQTLNTVALPDNKRKGIIKRAKELQKQTFAFFYYIAAEKRLSYEMSVESPII